MKLRTAFAIAAVIFSSGGPALAQPHGLGEFIAEFDANTDGVVTHAEYRKIRDTRFVKGDLDRSGSLNEAEYAGEYTSRLDEKLASSAKPAEEKAAERERQVKQAQVRFGVLDKDKNKLISLEEYLATGERSFSVKDSDKDGKVAASEPVGLDTN